MKKPKFSWHARVAGNGYIGPGITSLQLSVPSSFRAQPGQFILLPPLSKRSILPRPFSIVGISRSKKTPDVFLKIWIKKVGKNTALYSDLDMDDKISFIGPKGSPIKIGPEKKYILVAGNIGLAPLAFLIEKLLKRGKEVVVIVGTKGKKLRLAELYFTDLPENKQAKKISVSESGRHGKKVTDLLIPLLKEDGGQSRVVACGPKAMLEKVAELAADYGNNCEVIVEEIMACGTGSCKGCAIFGTDGTVKHVCSDGPTFDAKWIDWPKFMRRSKRPTPKPTTKKPKMSVCLKGQDGKILSLSSPLFDGSGCLSLGALERGEIDYRYIGALETKGITVQPRNGNAMPRICEVDDGAINSIGLENVGLEKFLSNKLPRWLKFGKPVAANISGFSLEEYEELAAVLGKTAIAALVVNISCPNIKEGGMIFGTDAHQARRITGAVRHAAPHKFVIVKLTPNVTDITSIALGVEQIGADAISVVNTFQAMDINVATRRPKIGAIIGGLSGPAIAPIALRMVYQLRQKLRIPIIGMGGIDSAETAAKFFMAGASAVAIGTGSFGRPNIFTEVFEGLEKEVQRQGFRSIAELSGSLITD